MTALAIIGGLVFMGIGLLMLVAPDFMWSWQRFNNRLEGQASERSDAWEIGRVLRGLMLLIGGLVFMLWGLSLD